MAEGPADKAMVGYTFAATAETRCAVCAHYKPYGESGECELVAGNIRPDATCNLFVAAPDPVVVTVDGYSVVKSDDRLNMVFGWGYLSVRKDGSTVVDHSGETVEIAELEVAAYRFALESRASGEDHDGGPVSGALVESFVVTDEKLAAMTADPETGEPDVDAFAAGRKNQPRGYWLGFYIEDDAAYERAKSSKSAFSIEGTAIREPVG